MADPLFLSATQWLASAVAGEIIGSRSDELAGSNWKQLRENLRQYRPEKNHVLPCAIYRACLQATLQCAAICYTRLGIDPDTRIRPELLPGIISGAYKFFRRESPHGFLTEAAKRWLDVVSSAICDRLEGLNKEDIDLSWTADNAEFDSLLRQVELLMQPGDHNQRERNMREALSRRILNDLANNYRERAGAMPEPFVQIVHEQWFELLCSCFQHAITHQPGLANIFHSNLLAKIYIQSERSQRLEITEELLQKLLDSLSRKKVEFAWTEIADRSEDFLLDLTADVLVGRDEALNTLDQHISAGTKKVMLVTGDAGFGKSALLATWTRRMRDSNHAIAAHFFSIRAGITSVRDAYLNLARQIKSYDEMASVSLELGGTEEDCREQLYYIISHWAACSERILVLILDGLDEADAIFRPPCPRPMPDRIAIIASVKTSKLTRPEELPGWVEDSAQLLLDRLDRDAIRSWLIRIGDGKLASFADNSHLLKKLEKKTGGFPLYLHFLLEDMVHEVTQDRDPGRLVDSSPSKFKKYVAEEFRRLAKDDAIRRKSLRHFFALLTVALGPIGEEDLSVLTGMNEWDFAGLPWGVRRWLKLGSFPSGEPTYYIAHPLLAVQFGEVLKRENSKARDDLIDHCLKWRTHSTRYPMEYGARHLAEADRWKDLHDLVANAEYRLKQSQAVPEQPDLPFNTLKAVIRTAFDKKMIPDCVRLLLIYGALMGRLYENKTPLDAIRSGDLKRTWKFADLSGTRSLWSLLIAWELQATNRSADALETITRLRELPRGPADGIPLSCVALLLAITANVAQEEFIQLEGQLLPRDGTADAKFARDKLAERLVRDRHFDFARHTVHGFPMDLNHIFRKIARTKADIGDYEGAVHAAERISGYPRGRAESYAEIALAMVKQGHDAEATEKFELAERYAEECAPLKRDWALKLIALRYAQASLLTKAHEIAQKIADHSTHAMALADIALSEAEQGLSPLETLQNARHQADLAESSDYALGEIAVTYSKTGRQGHCEELLSKIQAEILRTSNDKREDEFEDELMELAALQWRAGEKDQAERTVAKIESAWRRVFTLRKLARHRAQEGDIDGAVSMVENFESSQRREALTDIAWIAIDKENFEVARNLVARVLTPDVQEQTRLNRKARNVVLREIAVSRAQSEDPDAARTIIDYIELEDRSWALVEVGKSLARGGFIDDALALADLVRPTSDYDEGRILLEVACRQARDGCREAADQIVARLYPPKSSETLAELSIIYATQGDIAHAEAYAKRIPHWSPEIYTPHSALARAYATAGNVNEALERVKTLGQSTRDPSKSAASALVEVYLAASVDQERQAVLEAAKYLRKDEAARAQARISLAKAEQGSTSEALALAEKARRLARNCDDRVEAEVEVDTALARIVAKGGDEITKEFDDAKEAAFNCSCLNQIRDQITTGLARIGRWNEAISEFQKIGDVGYRQSVLLRLIELPDGPDLRSLVVETFQMSSMSPHDIYYPQGYGLVRKVVLTGDRQTFGELLLQGGESVGYAYFMSAAMTILHPEHAKDVAELVRDFSLDTMRV